ncbi:MAG: DNA polymerase IIIc chi subunit [Lentimonas sp.]|jgi:DNA polymerase IIIc chi subunit
MSKKTEINFYQIDDIIYKSIAPILTKILQDDKKAFIFCQNEKQLEEIDNGLWNFSKTKFIPHCTKNDKLNLEEQPILISNDQENLNRANYLIKLNEASEEFLVGFEKIFYFFGDGNLGEARKLWKSYKDKSYELNFYKKEGASWKKVDL